jgi:ATP-dependent DNA ligase
MLLAEVAEVSRQVTATSARLAKIAALASALRAAGPDEAPIVVAYLSGELPQRQIGVGWATLRAAPPPAGEASLAVSAVDAAFTRIGAVAGKGSTAERKRLIDEVFGAATAQEQHFLVRLLSGELRQGALDGVMTDAVAAAASVPVAQVRRAVMLGGSLPRAARAALSGGSEALAAFGLQVGQPLKPMLAASEATIADALSRIGGPAAIEWKLDGIRVQAHIADGQVRLFTRTLDDITSRVPEVVDVLRRLPVRSAVFDGELIALRDDGRPLPFQDTAARAASDSAGARGVGGTGEGRGTVAERGMGAERRMGAERGTGTGRGTDEGRGASGARGKVVPLSVFLFDVLHLDGRDLVDEPDGARREIMAGVVPDECLMPRLVTTDAGEAGAFFAGALGHGHEGVVVKSLAAPYAAGRRGAAWIKVKPRHTLDLVVLAAEWGHGRRTGWLSNLHLGARAAVGPRGDDPPSTPRKGYPGGWVMLGKTFKGLTDEMLAWQTARLLELEDHRDDWTVWVRPELVVEIAFDGVQRSPRYPGGVALRFARVLRYRSDKRPGEADTIDSVRALGAL